MSQQNLQAIVYNMGMTGREMNELIEGKVVERKDSTEDEVWSVGIDLNERTGIRVADGDRKLWRSNAQEQLLPKYNFGIMGCWLMDDNGVLRYIEEGSYGPEILQELKRRGLQNAAKTQSSGMRMS